MIIIGMSCLLYLLSLPLFHETLYVYVLFLKQTKLQYLLLCHGTQQEMRYNEKYKQNEPS